MQILADVLGEAILISRRSEQACFGAALTAGIGTGLYRDYHEAAELVPEPAETVEPRADVLDLYAERYGEYIRMYGAMTGGRKN